MTGAQYGVFAGAFAILFLVGNLHTAVFTEPMLVFSQKHYKSDFSCYVGQLIRIHWLFALAASLLCVLVGVGLFYWGLGSLATMAIALAMSMPLILLQWFVRRATYACFRPRIAAWGGACQLVLVIPSLLLVHQLFTLTPFLVFLILGGASLIVALGLMGALRISPFSRTRVVSRNQVIAQHWRLGRWMVAGSPFEWLPGNYYYLALPHIVHLAASGAMKAMMNFVQPMGQLHSALRLMLIPVLVEALGTPKFARVVVRSLVLMVGSAVIYYLALLCFGNTLVDVVYKGNYHSALGLLWLLGAVPIFTGLSGIGGGILRANERLDYEFRSYVVAGLASVLLGVPLMIVWKTTGAALSYLVSYALLVGMKFYFVGKLRS